MFSKIFLDHFFNLRMNTPAFGLPRIFRFCLKFEAQGQQKEPVTAPFIEQFQTTTLRESLTDNFHT